MCCFLQSFHSSEFFFFSFLFVCCSTNIVSSCISTSPHWTFVYVFSFCLFSFLFGLSSTRKQKCQRRSEKRETHRFFILRYFDYDSKIPQTLKIFLFVCLVPSSFVPFIFSLSVYSVSSLQDPTLNYISVLTSNRNRTVMITCSGYRFRSKRQREKFSILALKFHQSLFCLFF